jgi:hypothetical protein
MHPSFTCQRQLRREAGLRHSGQSESCRRKLVQNRQTLVIGIVDEAHFSLDRMLGDEADGFGDQLVEAQPEQPDCREKEG